MSEEKKKNKIVDGTNSFPSFLIFFFHIFLSSPVINAFFFLIPNFCSNTGLKIYQRIFEEKKKEEETL